MTDQDMEKLLTLVAERAASSVVARVPTKSDIEEISRAAATEAINALVQRLGIPEDNLDDWHADRLWLRNTRLIQASVVRQGIAVVVLALLGAIGTAVVFWIRSGAPR